MNTFALNPAQLGFIKAIGIIIITSVLAYLGDATHLNGILSPLLASLIAALASSLESHMKANSDNTTALFGSVTIKK